MADTTSTTRGSGSPPTSTQPARVSGGETELPAASTVGQSETTSQAPTERVVDEVGVSANIDERAVMRRVAGLVGADVPPLPRITYRPGNTSFVTIPHDPNFDVLDGLFSFRQPPIRNASALGTFRYDCRIRITVHNATVREVETVLAHELYHHLQVSRCGSPSPVRRETVDGRLANVAVIEGVPTYLMNVYHSRYVAPDGHTWFEQRVRDGATWQDDLSAFSPAGLLGSGLYVAGTHHVTARIDEPANVDRIRAAPPVTTEQLLHAETNATEPPLLLRSTVERGAGPWRSTDAYRFGELGVIAVLRQALTWENATMAAGWGRDRLLHFQTAPAEQEAGVWLVRMDDPTNASELGWAFRRYAARRGDDLEGGIRVDRVAPQTVAVVVGPPAFATGVSVHDTNASVTVTAPDG